MMATRGFRAHGLSAEQREAVSRGMLKSCARRRCKRCGKGNAMNVNKQTGKRECRYCMKAVGNLAQIK